MVSYPVNRLTVKELNLGVLLAFVAIHETDDQLTGSLNISSPVIR